MIAKDLYREHWCQNHFEAASGRVARDKVALAVLALRRAETTNDLMRRVAIAGEGKSQGHKINGIPDDDFCYCYGCYCYCCFFFLIVIVIVIVIGIVIVIVADLL